MPEQDGPALDIPTERVALAPYHRVFRAVEEAFETKRPFSLIRLGDGESAVLGYPEMVHPVRHARWMGSFFGPGRIDADQAVRLRAGLEAAIAGADVVGTYRERFADPGPAIAMALGLGALPKPSPAEMQAINFVERRLLNQLIAPHRPGGQLLTDANIHIKMHQTGFAIDMIRRSKAVSIISGNPGIAGVLGNVFGCTTFELTQVPGEFKWASDKADWKRTAPHFPTVFDEVVGRIRAGAVQYCVLVGAGPCGKIYCDEVRRAGGLALDVGSLMDLWCGRATRSYMKAMMATQAPTG
jgi:hypothetical protein